MRKLTLLLALTLTACTTTTPSDPCRISDATNIQIAFIVPLLCHLIVFYFALRGYKPAVAARVGASR